MSRAWWLTSFNDSMSTFVIFVCRGERSYLYSVSRHIISSHRNIFRVIRKDGDRWERPGWDRWVRARSPGDEKIYLDCETGDEAGAPADAAWQPGAASPGHWPPQSGPNTGAVNIRVTEKTWHVTERDFVTSETIKIESCVQWPQNSAWCERWVIIMS